YTNGRTYHDVTISVSTDNTNFTTVLGPVEITTQNAANALPELVVLSAAPKACDAGKYNASASLSLGSTSSCGTCANWTYSGSGAASCTSCPAVESGYSKLDSTGTGWTAYTKCVEIATASPSNCSSGKLQKIPTASGSTTWATATVNSSNPLNANPGYYVSGTSCATCGDSKYFCAGGTAERKTVQSGYYSTGGTSSTTRTSEAICEAGNKCVDGVKTACSGTNEWQDKTGQTSCETVTDGMYKKSNAALQNCGTSYYCKSGARNQCPNSGTTASETSSVIDQCYKSGMSWTVSNGTGTQRCFYTSGSGTSAVYSNNCDTKSITGCNGGYYRANTTDSSCTKVGIGYYSANNALTRSACTDWRANTSTTGETSSSTDSCVCVAGRYLNSSNTCTVCATGTYKASKGNSACTAAVSGQYVDATGATTYKLCAGLTSDGFYNKSDSGFDSSADCYGLTSAAKFVATASKGQVECTGGYCEGGAKVYYASGNGNTTGGRSTLANWTCPDASDAASDCYRSVTLKKNGMSGTLALPSSHGCKSISSNSGTNDATVQVYYNTACKLPTTALSGSATGTTYAGTGTWATSANAASGFVSSITLTDTSSTTPVRHAGKKYTCSAGYYLAANTNGACTACTDKNYCEGISGKYYSSSAQGLSACSDLDTSKIDGVYSSVSPRKANTDCRFTQNQQPVPTYCATKTSNTMTYSGTAWPANTYQVTAKGGSIISGNNSASATCSQCEAGKYSAGGTATSCSTVSDGCYGSAGATAACPNKCTDLNAFYTKSDGARNANTTCYGTTTAGTYLNSNKVVTDCEAKYYCEATKLYYPNTGGRQSCPDPTVSGNVESISDVAWLSTACPDATTSNSSIKSANWQGWSDTKLKSKSACPAIINVDTPCATFQIQEAKFNTTTGKYDTDSSSTRIASTVKAGYYFTEPYTSTYCTTSPNANMYYKTAAKCTANSYCPGATVPKCNSGTHVYGEPFGIYTCSSLGAFYTTSPAGAKANTACYGKTTSGKFIENAKDATEKTCAAGGYCPGSVTVNYNSTGGRTACDAGKYNASTGSSASSACVACALGSYASGTGNSACTACNAGTTTSSTGATAASSCTACANDNDYDNSWATPSWSANTVTNLCKISNCKPGSSYSSATGTNTTGSCTACAKGTYMSSSAHTNTTCTSAAKGYYVDTTGATGQKSCTGATYQDASGQSSCKSCPGTYTANTTNNKTSITSCQVSCGAGTRVAAANAACTSPAGGWFTAQHLVNYGQISPVNYCMAGYTS
ncbi:MAG: hypothetical protein II208_02925, partial [Alphaproteobacteria bacterium]|nr:hypothetical protein [Alphaproteobacteria bacterium]